MDIAVVWNSRAGGCASLDRDDVIRRIAEATGREAFGYDCVEARDPRACTRAALADGAKLIVAAGGDGTVSGCATELVGTGIPLGVLPLGTSSSFCAALEIPADLEGALANLARTELRTVDVAIARSAEGERTMILHCMIGLHAETIAGTSTSAKQRWGVLAYAASALRTLASFDPFAVEISTGTHHVRCQAVAIAAANVAPPKTVLAHGPSHLLGDDGQVDVTIVAIESIASSSTGPSAGPPRGLRTITEAIATGVHLYRSALEHEPATRDNVGSFSAPTVAIACEPPQAVLVDGEPFGHTPLTIETLPRALVVVAPPAAIAEGPPVEAPLLGLPQLEIDGVPVSDK